MDKAAVLGFIVNIIDHLWQTTLGPAATVIITGAVNKYVKGFVPRELQIPLAGVFGALAAGFLGADPATAGAGGAVVQAALSIKPEVALASAPLPAPAQETK